MANIKQCLLGLVLGLVVACGGETPPVLSGAVGTYNYQITPNQPETKVGTAITLMLRQGNARTTSPALVNVVGPSGWNNNQALNLTYPTGSDWILSPESEIAAVAGEYTVTATMLVGNQSLKTSQKLTLGSTTDTLGLTSIALTGITRNTVRGTWSAPNLATGYLARVVNATDDVGIHVPIYTTTPEANFPSSNQSLDLNPSKTNLFLVYSTNFDTVVDNPKLPSQVNYSDSAVFIPNPSINATSSRRIPRSQLGLLVKP
jgi:hypothetical protein